MEEKIKESTEYLLMAINDIKDYKDFINYKPELIKAINDIKNSIKIPTYINDSEDNDKKSKISSILGLQFDYDSLINEKDAKFFSDYEDKTNKIRNKINSYFQNNNKILTQDNNKIIKNENNKNILYNPDKTLNCTESLRNKNKLLNKKNNNNNNSNKRNLNRNKLIDTRYLHNMEKKNKNENNIDDNKKYEKIDTIAEIIMKMNNEEYIYDVLVKLFGNHITDKLLSAKVSDDLVEAVKNTILEIEKINKNHTNTHKNNINNNNNKDNISEKINKLYKEKYEMIKNSKKINKLKNELNLNSFELNDKINMKNYRSRRNKSSNKFRYSEPYQEFNFKNSLRTQTPFNLNKTRSNTNHNEIEIKGYSKNKILKNKKSNDSPFKMTYNNKPFISATCGYGKYFDEPLQKGGISKLDSYKY